MQESNRNLNTNGTPLSKQEQVKTPSPDLRVGIFVDLDNINFKTHGRSDIQEFFRPLRSFARAVGTMDTFQAFSNQATRTFTPTGERERREEGSSLSKWDQENSFTGLDENEVLRCGICGAKMNQLTKKNKQNGIVTMEQKLDMHMKMLHDREEAKRKNRRKQTRKGKLSPQQHAKSKKYQQAQIDYRHPQVNNNKNQLVAVLKTQGIRCRASENVDDMLIEEALAWMDRCCDDDAPRSGTNAPKQLRGCLVVVSKDSDFGELLRTGRRKGFLAMSVSEDDHQTAALARTSDLVLTTLGDGGSIPQPTSPKGSLFMIDAGNVFGATSLGSSKDSGGDVEEDMARA